MPIGKKDMIKYLNEFEFGSVPKTNYGIICP